MATPVAFMSPPRVNGFVVRSDNKNISKLDAVQSNKNDDWFSSPQYLQRTPIQHGESPATPVAPGSDSQLMKRGRPRADTLPKLSIEGIYCNLIGVF